MTKPLLISQIDDADQIAGKTLAPDYSNTLTLNFLAFFIKILKEFLTIPPGKLTNAIALEL